MFNWEKGGRDEYSNWQAKYYNVSSKVKIKTDLILVNGKKYLLLSLNTINTESLNKDYTGYLNSYKLFYSSRGFPIVEKSSGYYDISSVTEDTNTLFIGEPINRWWYGVNFDTGYTSIYKVKADSGYRPPQAKDLIKVRSTGKVILLGGDVTRSVDSLGYYVDIRNFFLDATYNNVSEHLVLNDKQTNNLTFTLNSFSFPKDLDCISDNTEVFTSELYTKMYKVILNRKYKLGNKLLSDFNSHLYSYFNRTHMFTLSSTRDSDIANTFGTHKTHPSMQTIANIPRVSSVYTIAEMPEREFKVNIDDRTGKIDKTKIYIRFNEESTKTSLLDKVRLISGSKYSILYNNKVLFKGTIMGADDDPYPTITTNVSPLINVSSPTRRTIRIDSLNSEGLTDYFNEFNSRDKVIINKVFQLN